MHNQEQRKQGNRDNKESIIIETQRSKINQEVDQKNIRETSTEKDQLDKKFLCYTCFRS